MDKADEYADGPINARMNSETDLNTLWTASWVPHG